jgi:hypothetical protein
MCTFAIGILGAVFIGECDSFGYISHELDNRRLYYTETQTPGRTGNRPP